MFLIMDEDENGQISKEEFLNCFFKFVDQAPVPPQSALKCAGFESVKTSTDPLKVNESTDTRDLSKLLDADGTGYLNKKLKNTDGASFKVLDADGDGKILP